MSVFEQAGGRAVRLSGLAHVLEFGILGPLEVVEDGRPVSLGGPRQRALLAILLVQLPEVVSADRLIELLWDGRPPVTAAKTLQGYVSHLRKVLGAGVIVTEAGGYRLMVAPEQTDVGRFEALSSEGRRALAGGDAGVARERLGGALGLWRGEPLADFAYRSFAQGAVGRLQQARLGVLEDRIEADLALGADGDLVGELEWLVAENPLQERLRGQLMVSLYRAGRQAEALSVYRQTSKLLREELGLAPSQMLQELERLILEQDGSLNGARAAPVALRPVVCPFKGLACFEQADAEYFFGRERLVSEVTGRLADSTLVGILGPSGIGKSSLLRAGVLAAVSGGVLPGSDAWRQVLLRPGAHPQAELHGALGEKRLGEALAQLRSGERLLIAVDQLEELFTVCDDEGERAGFLEDLAAAARAPDQRARVLVALRVDFYGRLAAYPSFGSLLSSSHVLVAPMDRQELIRAIEQPAASAELELERGLADALVGEVLGEPGGLPLLSTALLGIWRAREQRLLSYESYRRTGGVRGAVAHLAEQAYAQLGESERGIARAVMLRLASGDQDSLTRRRLPLAELERQAGVAPVVSALTDARLLTVSDGEVEVCHEALLREWPRYRAWLEEDRAGRQLHAHLEASAREWKATGHDPGDLYRGARLAGALEWATQNDEQLAASERRFLDASRRRAGRSARQQRAILLGVSLLLAAAVLAGIIGLVQKHQARVEARVALARQLGAEAINEPRLDLAMLLTREAVSLDRSPQTESSLLATLQRAPALTAAFAFPVTAALQPFAVSPDGGSIAVGEVNPSQLAPDGTDVNGELRSYDTRTRQAAGPLLTDFGGALAPVYSSDGALLAYPTTTGQSPAIVVRNAHTLRLVRELRLPVLQLAKYTPDLAQGRILIAPNDHTVYCAYRDFAVNQSNQNPVLTVLTSWSLPDGRLLSTIRIDPGAVMAVNLTDAGTRVTVVDPHRITVFDAHSLQQLSLASITPAPVAPSAAAISPGGRTIAIASNTTVTFIDTATGAQRHAIGPDAGSITTLTYSPDGRGVASATDNTVIIWNPRTATPQRVLPIPGGQLQSETFSQDGQTLYTSSGGGLVLEWDLTGERSFGRQLALGSSSAVVADRRINRLFGAPLAPPLAVSPDGTSIAVRLRPSTVGLFSAQTLKQQASFTVTPASATITALAWSPDAPELAVGGSSGLLQLWRVDGPPHLVRSLTGGFGADLAENWTGSVIGREEAIGAVAFSPDGRLVAASSNTETGSGYASFFLGNPQTLTSDYERDRESMLAIWSASSGELTALPLYLGYGSSQFDPLAFSPDGRLVAAGTPDGHDLIVDAKTGQPLKELGDDFTQALAFAPDGTLATATVNGIVQLWNPIRGTHTAEPLPVSAGPISSIAFDPNGQSFVTTATQNGVASLFNTASLQQEGAGFTTDQDAMSTAAFVLHGRSLLVVNDKGNGFIWPMSLTAWEQRACAIAGRNLSPQEWSRYLPGQAYAPVCT